MDQRVMDADALGDVLQRDAVESVLRKQMFGGIEYLLHRFGALLGLGRPFRLGFCLGRQIHFPFRGPWDGRGSIFAPTPDHIPPAIAFCRSCRSGRAASDRSEEHTSELQSLM